MSQNSRASIPDFCKKKIQGRNIGIPVLKGREGVKGSGILGQKMKSKGWKLDRD